VSAQQVQALLAAGRTREAVDLRRRMTAAKPSAASEHNLAALLGDLGHAAEAEAAARRAFAHGGDAPETWLVLARAVTGQGRHSEGEAAYREALRRRPLYVEALRELSQLIWMTTAERDAALEPIHGALRQAPAAGALHVLKAVARRYAGDDPRAIWADLNAAGLDDQPDVQLAALDEALLFDPDQALVHAARLPAADPRSRVKQAEVRLVRGEPEPALDLLRPVVAARPHDQNALAMQATAERLLGIRGLNDYDALVSGHLIDTPPGWADLPAFLSDLAGSLRRLHTLKTHPVGQSLRHGTQTPVDLKASDDPTIQAFFTAIDGPIRRHIERLGRGPDPLRGRNRGGYRLLGCWSVQLRPNGYHAAHVHPEGWLSSACYIELPDAVEAGGKEGWIGFGAPPFPVADRMLEPERYEKPEPGKLVLFPSYLWHGTVPFSGEQPRLTVAFDVAPA